ATLAPTAPAATRRAVRRSSSRGSSSATARAYDITRRPAPGRVGGGPGTRRGGCDFGPKLQGRRRREAKTGKQKGRRREDEGKRRRRRSEVRQAGGAA